MSGARFVRFYPSDWRSGCIGLSLEQQGFYIAVCAFIYDTDQRLPANDSAAAKLLGVHTNAYKKLRDQLAAVGKIVFANGVWTVPRADKELAAAHQARSQKRPADQDTGQETCQDTIGDTPQETPQVFPEKDCKNNDPISGAYSLSLIQKENNHPPTEYAAHEGGQEDDPIYEKCKLAFNGSTDRFIDEIRNAKGVYGTKANAAEWLSKVLDDFGADAIKGAFRFLDEKRERGEGVSRVLSFLESSARTKAENSRKKQAAEVDKKAGLKPMFNRMTGEIEWRKPYEPYVEGHA